MTESRDIYNKQQKKKDVHTNGSRFEILAEEIEDKENLVEVQVLKDLLESIPGPTTYNRLSPKKKGPGITIGSKLKAGLNMRNQSTKKERPKENVKARQSLRET